MEIISKVTPLGQGHFNRIVLEEKEAQKRDNCADLAIIPIKGPLIEYGVKRRCLSESLTDRPTCMM